MPHKKGKLPPVQGAIIWRAATVVTPERVVTATENPIPKWDEKTQQVVNEVLLMDGCVFRGGRDQTPIVDSHDDSTVRNIVGSLRGLRIDRNAGELYGVPSWSSDPDSQKIATKFNEGHITDFSITAQPLETLFIKRGESYLTPRGATIEGPALIHTRWEPHNASICTTGADVDSTVRRSYTDLQRRTKRMDAALLARFQERGLPEGMTDPDQILTWVDGNLSAAAPAATPSEPPASEPVQNAEPSTPTPAPEEDPEKKEQPAVENTATVNQEDVVRTERARVKEIRAACTIHRMDQTFADELCESNVTIDGARERILRKLADASQPLGSTVTSNASSVRVTESQDDKYFAAARDGLLKRSFGHSQLKAQPYEKAAPGADDFKHARTRDIAREVVERMGVSIRNVSPIDIMKIALGHPATMQRHRVQRDTQAYHTTGSFQNLLMDVSNKTLLAAYAEAPSTWQMWARQAESVPDFKPIYRMRLSEMADLEQIPEGHAYPESALSDKKESYKVEKYGSTTSVSWETFVNDDLNALSQIPTHQARSARRTQNRAVYGVLTGNAALADGGALFNNTAQSTAGGHANLSGASAVPSVTTLNTAYAAIMTKYGLNASAILGLMPKYIIVPAALSGTLLELTSSISPPGQGGSTPGNSGVNNIYGPTGDRPLVPVVEPILDANSTAAWYLATNAGDCDTVEVAFLQGEESPVIENDFDFDRDVYKYKVRQTFGVAAIDFRGLYKYFTS